VKRTTTRFIPSAHDLPSHQREAITVERSDWPCLYVRRGGVAAFCAADTFWRLLDKGPVVAVFENRGEGHAVIEAYEAERRRLH
jgi:hypothetical protein